MQENRYPLLIGACAVFLVAGCAQTGGPQVGVALGDAPQRVKVEPVYRVQQPVGTAAGQYAVGRIDLAEGRHDAAIRRFKAALQLDPSFVEAHNGLGVAYGQVGRFAEAAEAFRAALASGPAQAHVLNNLGFAQLKAGQLDEAWISLRRSYDLEPANAKTRENLVLLAEARRLAAQRSVAPPVAAAAIGEPERAEPAPIAASAPVEFEPAPIVASAPVEFAPAPIAASEPIERAPEPPSAVELAAMEPAPAPAVMAAPPGEALVAVAQASAAKLLGEKPNPAAYEVVISKTGDAELVQLSANVYELRSNAVAIAAPAAASVTAPAKPASEPAAAVVKAPAARPRLAAEAARQVPEVAVAPVRTYRVEARVATVPELPAIRPVANVASSAPKVLAPPPLASLKAVAGLEVSNAVGLRSLAGRTARQLERFGASVTRVSDYRVYGKGRTEVHYRAGHVDGAKAVQQRLPVEAKLVEVAKMHPGVNVRLVVGRDMVVGPVAWWSEDPAVAESATMARAEQLAPPTIGLAPAVSEGVEASLAIAAPRGIELKAFAAKVARVDVEDGWRHL